MPKFVRVHHNNLHKSILIKIINIKINQLAGRGRQTQLEVSTINISRCTDVVLREKGSTRVVYRSPKPLSRGNGNDIVIIVLENSHARFIMRPLLERTTATTNSRRSTLAFRLLQLCSFVNNRTSEVI